jgi:hypothetical protein
MSLDNELKADFMRPAEILLEAAKSGKQRSTTATAGCFVEDGSDVEADIDGEDLGPVKFTRVSDD